MKPTKLYPLSKFSKHSKLSLCLAALFATPAVWLPAWAQVVTGEGLNLEQVTVTANPLRSGVQRAGETLSGDALLLNQGASLGETLSGMAGVDRTYFGAHASRPIIRGQDGDRIRVLSNGAGQNDASALSFDHAVAESSLGAERIEVLRGPAALTYGGSAVGGVVNVIDSRIAEKPHFDDQGGKAGQLGLQYDTQNAQKRGHATLKAGNNAYSIYAHGYTANAREGAVPVELPCDVQGTVVVRPRICNSQAKSSGAVLGYTQHLERGSVGLAYQTGTQLYGSVAEDAVTLDMKNRSLEAKAVYKPQSTWLEQLDAQVKQSTYAHNELDDGMVATQFKNKTVGAQTQLKLRPIQAGWGSVKSLMGLQADTVKFDAIGDEAFVPASRTENRALYALVNFTSATKGASPTALWMPSEVNLGVRRDSQQLMGYASANGQFSDFSKQHNGNSFAFGSQWNLGAWRVHYDWARTTRLPKDYELLADGDHVATGVYERGDKTLRPETAKHHELGARWGKAQGPRFNAQVFQTRFDNYIYLKDSGAFSASGSPEFAYVQSAAKFQGFEVGAALPFAVKSSGLGALRFELDAKASTVRATETPSGERLPRIPAKKFAAGLSAKVQAFTVKLGAEHYAAQKQVTPGTQTTTAYTLWNASVMWRQPVAGNTLKWYAKLDNATNRLAYPASSILTTTQPGRVPLPGRSLKLGLQYEF